MWTCYGCYAISGITYRKICAENGLEVPGLKWTRPKVIENDQAEIPDNQPDIVVVDKQEKNAVVVDVAILSDGNIRKKKHERLLRAERGAVEDVGSKGISGASCDGSTWGYNPQTGKVAPADSRIWDLCAEEHSPRNSLDTAQAW